MKPFQKSGGFKEMTAVWKIRLKNHGTNIFKK